MYIGDDTFVLLQLKSSISLSRVLVLDKFAVSVAYPYRALDEMDGFVDMTTVHMAKSLCKEN